MERERETEMGAALMTKKRIFIVVVVCPAFCYVLYYTGVERGIN